MVHTSSPRTWEGRGWVSGVQGQSQLDSKLEVSLDYVRPLSLRKPNKQKMSLRQIPNTAFKRFHDTTVRLYTYRVYYLRS